MCCFSAFVYCASSSLPCAASVAIPFLPLCTLGLTGGRCGVDWGPRTKLELEGSLPTIFEFGNQLPELLLPALIRRQPLYTHHPAQTQ
ncbi:hypothetical protein TIFTF001_032994 [Ficus carica]|uniref:Secreted protein n=1 Tax=Ficus carica TaxID=3494 RepID=A0AA88J6J5_FICCA|nr:hypothetical protein TIFTF001_032994 [Ficus carica]